MTGLTRFGGGSDNPPLKQKRFADEGRIIPANHGPQKDNAWPSESLSAEQARFFGLYRVICCAKRTLAARRCGPPENACSLQRLLRFSLMVIFSAGQACPRS